MDVDIDDPHDVPLSSIAHHRPRLLSCDRTNSSSSARTAFARAALPAIKA